MMIRISGLALMLAVLTGCTGMSPVTRFYVLGADAPVTTEAAAATRAALKIGVGPIELPAMLNRPQLVTRLQDNRVDVADFHRWAGELGGNMARVLASRLMTQLATDQVFIHPWPSRQKMDYQVRIQVFRFDGVLGQEAVLAGTYMLVDDQGETLTRAFRFTAPLGGGDHQALVAAMDQLLVKLADQVVASIGNP